MVALEGAGEDQDSEVPEEDRETLEDPEEDRETLELEEIRGVHPEALMENRQTSQLALVTGVAQILIAPTPIFRGAMNATSARSPNRLMLMLVMMMDQGVDLVDLEEEDVGAIAIEASAVGAAVAVMVDVTSGAEEEAEVADSVVIVDHVGVDLEVAGVVQCTADHAVVATTAVVLTKMCKNWSCVAPDCDNFSRSLLKCAKMGPV